MNFIILLFALRIIESKKHLRIIGGRDAEENEYVYVARIETIELRNGNIIERLFMGTSTILTPDWTLAAAHCVDTLNLLHIRRNQKRSVKKGVIWYGHVDDAATEVAYSDILYVVQHPATILNLWKEYVVNEIALIRTQPIKIKEYGKMSALDAKSLIGQEVHVVGYGFTNYNDGKFYDTLVLKKPLQVLKVIIKSCSADNIVMYPALCLARPCTVLSSTLPGDSGGPVIHPSGVVGFNSMGDYDMYGGGKSHFTVGYITPTSPFTDWMSSIIQNTAKP